MGLLDPVQVWRRPDGAHRLIDGERRWRAAQKVGLVEIPCDAWPTESDPRRVAVAGLVLNEHRRAHGCLHVARRLRDIKNHAGLSHLEVATQTGLPLDRVKTYFSLFGASDPMLTFLEEKEVPLKVAVELVRYEKATNEARARRLLQRYGESPLTVHDIVKLKVDADPAWRATAVFTRTEAETVISDERVPEDRRAAYALLFLAGVRFGEAAALRWRDYDAAAEPLGRLHVAQSYNTKTRRVKSTK